jgi:hypothetical protein
MLFSSRDPEHRSHAIHLVRDVVEIVAIVLAGAWAFYVFIYENRIVPSFTDMQTEVSATLQKTSQRDGATGISLKTAFKNSGAVRFYFVGYAVTVLGTKMTLSPQPTNDPHLRDSLHTYFTLSKPTPVYGFGFITDIGDPSSAHESELEPGGNFSQEHTFYIPANRFDLLTVRVSACITKSADRPIPSKFKLGIEGATDVTCGTADHITYDVGSLDLRK